MNIIGANVPIIMSLIVGTTTFVTSFTERKFIGVFSVFIIIHVQIHVPFYPVHVNFCQSHF